MSVSLRRNTFCLSLLCTLALCGDLIQAQDPPMDAAAEPKPKAAKSREEKPTPDQELKAEKERLRLIKVDVELRARFANTVWNDVQLTAGESGYTWWLKIRKNKGPEKTWERKWHLSDQKQLPEVGTWDVKKGELLLIATDGRVVARGRMDQDEEVHGEYYNPDRKQTYGSFHLIEENRRQYTIVPFRVIDRNAGK